MFWRKKKIKWYSKMWNEWRQLFVSLSTVFGIMVSGYSYIAIDTNRFLDTTKVVAAADTSNLYVQIDVESELNENTVVLINLDGQQVASRIYPKGINEGKILIDVPLPFTSKGEYLSVNVEIIVSGLRNLFQPETLETTLDIKKHGVKHEGNSNSNSYLNFNSKRSYSI